LAFREELVTRLTSNPGKILRYMWIPQVLTGLFLIGLAYYIGNTHFHLIREGVRAPGRIVAYKQENFGRSSGPSSTAFMPIVEFQVNDRSIQFKDWMGSNSTGAIYNPVTVFTIPPIPR
jgi:hypothetical protein